MVGLRKWEVQLHALYDLLHVYKERKRMERKTDFRDVYV